MVNREIPDAQASEEHAAGVANVKRQPALESVLSAHSLLIPSQSPRAKPDHKPGEAKAKSVGRATARPTAVQKKYLVRGIEQPGGKLPLFDDKGQEIDARTIRACVEKGWAEPWFANPLKPGWLVCKLTDKGRALFSQ